jgi:predicted MFS family arabinose efflux permease
MRQVWKDSSTAYALLANAALYVAFESISVTYGAHLERDFSMDAAQVGRVASLLGFAELSGSFTSSMVVDRLRPRRTLLLGLVGLMAGLGVVSFLGENLLLFTIGLMALFVLMEYSLVSIIPLLSEQQQERRAAVLATAPVLASVARSATDSWSARLFVTSGFPAVGGFALLAVATSASLIWWWVEER